jgi:hypothetical protein
MYSRRGIGLNPKRVTTGGRTRREPRNRWILEAPTPGESKFRAQSAGLSLAMQHRR